MMSTDSEVMASSNVDYLLLGVVCMAGLAAVAVHWLLGLPATDLLALMIVASVGLTVRLNLRLVALLKRQRNRKQKGVVQ